MLNRNKNLSNLSSGYLFPEITKRKTVYLKAHPDAKIISLGIGNTTEPLTPHIVEGLHAEVAKLGTKEGYTGYGADDTGLASLRTQIAEVLYKKLITSEEVFISDGAKFCHFGVKPFHNMRSERFGRVSDTKADYFCVGMGFQIDGFTLGYFREKITG